MNLSHACTLQHIINQETSDIVSKPAFTPDSVLDLEKGTPSQCEAILFAGLCGKCDDGLYP